jgi:cell division protein FtsZ
MENLFFSDDINHKDTVIKIISVSNESDSVVRYIAEYIGVECVYFEEMKDNTNIKNKLENTDVIFLIGNENANIISEIAADLNILTIAVVTNSLENEVMQKCTKLVCNEDENHVLKEVLLQSVTGITDLFTHAGMINIDVSDISEIMKTGITAITNTGSATGYNRATKAVEKAINSPLFSNEIIKNTHGILVNISAADMEISEFAEVGDFIAKFTTENTIIKIGMSAKQELGNEMKITVVFTNKPCN